jgi:hypothetical protein
VTELDPKKLFKRLATDILTRLHGHTFIVASLAAAYHFRIQLERRAVNTKDADIVVHPAGDVRSCRDMAEHLLAEGWVRTDNCYPSPRAHPPSGLRAVRLHPKRSQDYFITTTAVLLSGLGVTQDNLRVVAEELKEDLFIPIALRGRRSR